MEEKLTNIEAGNLEKATFAAGCFWCVEEEFARLPGVTTTRVGYAGGKTQEPNYKQVCAKNTGHAEVLELSYDPIKISYQELLNTFFKLHNPGSATMQGHDNAGQYRSAIFYHNEAQQALAAHMIERLEASKKFGPKIYTQLAPAPKFWEAEGYHQKYYLKNK